MIRSLGWTMGVVAMVAVFLTCPVEARAAGAGCTNDYLICLNDALSVGSPASEIGSIECAAGWIGCVAEKLRFW